jgi:hypothetical protein
MRAKGEAIDIIDVRSATAVEAYVPFTALPKRFAGKQVGIFEIEPEPETTNPSEEGLEGLDALPECGND